MVLYATEKTKYDMFKLWITLQSYHFQIDITPYENRKKTIVFFLFYLIAVR